MTAYAAAPLTESAHRPSLLRDRELLLVCVGTFAFWWAVAVHLPLLPLYLGSLGMRPGLIGVIYGVGALGAVLGRVLITGLVERLSERTFILAGGVIWLVTAMFPLGTEQVQLLVGWWVLKGLGLGIFTTGVSAWVARARSGPDRERAMALWTAMNPIAFVAGPAAVGLLMLLPAPYVAGFAATGVAALVSLVAALPRRPMVPARDGYSSGSQRALAASQVLPGALALVMAVGATAVTVYVPVLVGAGPGSSVAGWLLAGYAGASVAVRLVSTPVSLRHGRWWVIGPGLSVMAAGLIVLGVAGGAGSAWLAVASVLVGVGVGATTPALASWAVERAPQESKGSAVATHFLLYEVGLVAGGAVLGPLLDAVGAVAFVGVGALSLVAVVAIGARERQHGPHSGAPRVSEGWPSPSQARVSAHR